MMQNFLGVDKFREGIQVDFVNVFPMLILNKTKSDTLSAFRIFLTGHQFSNAEASDLWRAMSKVRLWKFGNLFISVFPFT